VNCSSSIDGSSGASAKGGPPAARPLLGAGLTTPPAARPKVSMRPTPHSSIDAPLVSSPMISIVGRGSHDPALRRTEGLHATYSKSDGGTGGGWNTIQSMTTP
jgi:hypothetical protein